MRNPLRFRQPLLAILLALLPATLLGAGPVEESQTHIREAAAAFRNDDLAGFVASLEAAFALNPASLSTRYNLACGYALIGQRDKALDLLDGLTAERVDLGMATDPDLDSLRNSDRFQALVRRVVSNTQPVLASEPFVTFQQIGLIPEGIARDPASGRLFFGSMRTGEVYAVDTDGQISRFGTIDSQNRLSAVGMTVDTENGLLWVVGSTFELAENAGATPAAISGLFALDLASGALRETLLVESSDEYLNDVLLAADGRLFATGSGVFAANRTTNRLKRIETSVEVFGSNGIALAPDGRTLLVTSYPVGLYAVDANTGAARKLDKPRDTTLYGLDGLYWHNGSLIGIQNGVSPWRLLRLHLDNALTRVTAVGILEMGNPATTPLTGAIVADSIYYVGESKATDTVPSQFPATMEENLGAVTIRRASLGHR